MLKNWGFVRIGKKIYEESIGEATPECLAPDPGGSRYPGPHLE